MLCWLLSYQSVEIACRAETYAVRDGGLIIRLESDVHLDPSEDTRRLRDARGVDDSREKKKHAKNQPFHIDSPV